MSASQECKPRRTRHLVPRLLILGILVQTSLQAADARAVPSAGCDVAGIAAHVLEQMRVYGLKSQKHEYFGFIFRKDGKLGSAVVRSGECRGPGRCIIETSAAASGIPKGAKVLGEWHTHPHDTGSRSLSKDDVQGARQNAHLSCYTAYYATPDGDIHAWDASRTSVPTAMASRSLVGNYHSHPHVAEPEPASR